MIRIFLLFILIHISILGTAQDISTLRITPLPTQRQLPVANIHRILEDTEGYMWYATYGGGLCRDDGYQIEVFRSDSLSPELIGRSNDVLALCEDSVGNIIFGTRDGLFILDKRTYGIGRFDERFTGKNVDNVFVASDGSVWVYSRHKLFHYDKSHEIIDSIPLSWRGKTVGVARIMEDSSRQMWVSLWGGGIICYSPTTKKITDMPWNDDLQPMDMVEDGKSHHLWVATWGNGLVEYNPKTGETSIKQETLEGEEGYGSQIINMIRVGGRLYTSTMQGLYAYDIVGSSLHRVDLSPLIGSGMNITDFMELDRRGRLWVSGFSPHTYIISSENTDIVREDFHDSYNIASRQRIIVFKSVKDSNGIWMGLDRLGICYFDYATRQLLRGEDSGGGADWKSMNIKTIQPCEEGGIYCQAGNNIYKVWWNGQKIQCLLSDGSLRSLFTQAPNVVTDYLGHQWTLSDQQLREWSPTTGNYRIIEAADPSIDLDYFQNITVEDSTVRVDGAGGIVNIKPSGFLDLEKGNAYPVMTSVSIDGNRSLLGRESTDVEVPSGAVNIEFRFSTLNHLNTDKVRYAYRLEGIDHEWHELPVGSNSIVFTSLPKGRYTLMLKATDEHGCWGEEKAALHIHRLPAWWQTWWAYMLYALLSISLVTFLIAMLMRRQKEVQRQAMEKKLTELKFRFFTNVSHELRTPLTLILTPLGTLRRRIGEMPTEAVARQLTVIDTNAQRLLTLVNRLLDYRKMEMGHQRLELMNGDIFEFIYEETENFQPLSREKGIGLGCAIPNRSLYMMFDRQKMHHVISNLLSNAFKFTPQGGNIVVKASEQDESVSISVSDSGCGIADKDLPHIFDRYFQGSQSDGIEEAAGTGIGLSMVQEFVKMHGGTVSVESSYGHGATFTVIIPTAQNSTSQSASPRNLSDSETLSDSTNIDGEDESPLLEEGSTILVVDDNDEFRQFLCGELQEQYNILQASDGKEALAIAEEHDIDLIVSDIMMPGMDGMELCKQLKGNVNTSHIMVILLTARTAEEIKIEGFRAGADDYLSKPFNMEMLNLRINHLLELRRRRTQEFQKAENVKPEKVAMSEVDQKFLADALAAVERNMSNEDYDIDSFASDVFMSRSTLYRKIVALTGQKPTEFIRTLRLKRAAALIREGKHSLTDIGYMCGFSSPSYFYRCFKKQYGVQPGNY